MVLIQPLRFNLSCPPVTALFTVKYIHLQIEDSTPVVDSYFKVLIISIIVVFTFFRIIVKKLTLFLGTKTLLSMMTFQNYSLLGKHLKRVYGNTRQPVGPCAEQQNQRNLAHF